MSQSELRRLIQNCKKRMWYCEEKHHEAVWKGNPDRGFKMMTLYMQHFDMLNQLENELEKYSEVVSKEPFGVVA